MKLRTLPYNIQSQQWPGEGRHILAAHDSESVVVYQAYPRSIGEFAAAHGRLGGEFNYARMSWIKPNFLWMMSRSGWGRKTGQEITLGIRLSRGYFESLLGQAVSSSFDREFYASREAWAHDVAISEVRLQWDPDHDPAGRKLARRALQLGLKGQTLERYGKREILEIIDMTSFVEAQRPLAKEQEWSRLETPEETVLWPSDPQVRMRLGLDDAL
jgi:Domain of unknown function (DUF4291)